MIPNTDVLQQIACLFSTTVCILPSLFDMGQVSDNDGLNLKLSS